MEIHFKSKQHATEITFSTEACGNITVFKRNFAEATIDSKQKGQNNYDIFIKHCSVQLHSQKPHTYFGHVSLLV